MSAIDRYTRPLTADEFQKAAFEDRVPVSYTDCEKIAKVSEEVCKDGGYYTIGAMVRGMGYVVTAYTKEDEIAAAFIINRPVESEDRKIPTMSWLRHKFKSIGHDHKSNCIKQMSKIIENHIRDGGTWEYLSTNECIQFELKSNGATRSKHTFYQEGLFI